MKKYALSVLHVFSIVLAVAIGMTQMGKSEIFTVGSAEPCTLAITGGHDCGGGCGLYFDDEDGSDYHSTTENYGNYESNQCYVANSPSCRVYQQPTVSGTKDGACAGE